MAVIEAIETVYLEADVTSITFSSLGSYEHLQLRGSVRTDRASALEPVAVQFNLDTGANYQTIVMYGNSTTEAAGAEHGQVRAHAASWMPTTTATSTAYGSFVCDILDYRNGSKNTTLMHHTGTIADYTYVTFGTGLWDNVAAVTQFKIYPNNGSDFARGSEFTLFGLASS
jgi:hypothetical protein